MNRVNLDIIVDILKVARQNVFKGRITQKCGLSTAQFNKYMQMLLQSGLIDGFPAFNLHRISSGPKSKQRMVFRTTKDGKDIITRYSQLCALVEQPKVLGMPLTNQR